jgi:hypothetical protein
MTKLIIAVDVLELRVVFDGKFAKLQIKKAIEIFQCRKIPYRETLPKACG